MRPRPPLSSTTLYRVRHVESGLFYGPCGTKVLTAFTATGAKVSTEVKTNLKVKPKIYQVLPSIGLLSGTFYNHRTVQFWLDKYCEGIDRGDHTFSGYVRYPYRETICSFYSSDWEVEHLNYDSRWVSLGPLKKTK